MPCRCESMRSVMLLWVRLRILRCARPQKEFSPMAGRLERVMCTSFSCVRVEKMGPTVRVFDWSSGAVMVSTCKRHKMLVSKPLRTDYGCYGVISQVMNEKKVNTSATVPETSSEQVKPMVVNRWKVENEEEAMEIMINYIHTVYILLDHYEVDVLISPIMSGLTVGKKWCYGKIWKIETSLFHVRLNILNDRWESRITCQPGGA